MKKLSKGLFLTTMVALTTALLGCVTSHPPFDPGTINHVVLITLEDPADAEALQTDCDRMLATIPSVTVYACGRHVETGRSSAVNTDYSLGLLVSFEDMKGYQTYLDHPSHLRLLEKWKSRFSDLTIYDIGNEKISE